MTFKWCFDTFWLNNWSDSNFLLLNKIVVSVIDTPAQDRLLHSVIIQETMEVVKAKAEVTIITKVLFLEHSLSSTVKTYY